MTKKVVHRFLRDTRVKKLPEFFQYSNETYRCFFGWNVVNAAFFPFFPNKNPLTALFIRLDAVYTAIFHVEHR